MNPFIIDDAIPMETIVCYTEKAVVCPYKPQSTYRNLEKKDTKVLKFIEWHMREIVGAMGRKVCLNKSKLGYRRSINVSERIHQDLMLDLFKAVRDHHHVRIGVRATRDDLKKPREDGSVLRELKIVFKDENSACFHLGKGSGLGSVKLRELWTRKLDGGCVGRIVCDEERPITLIWGVRNCMLRVSCHFVVVNKQGNVVKV